MSKAHRFGTIFALALFMAGCSGGVATDADDGDSLSLSIANGAIDIAVGEATQLNALPTDSTGKAVGGLYTIAWSSASNAIAKIDASGKLTGVAAGSTTINATATVVKTGVTASASATVTVGGATKTSCGDGTCNASESCTTCPADCGTCATTVTSFIFSSTVTPADPRGNDGTGIELGVKIRVTSAGSITKLRFYKGAGTTGTHVGNLWSSAGTLLASVAFASETASGWQEAQLTTPVALTIGTTYVASVHSSSGDYASTNSYFTQAVVNGPLRALADGEDGKNGVYKYSATSAFPTDSYQATNYFVDVVFATTTGTTTTKSAPPAPTGTAMVTQQMLLP